MLTDLENRDKELNQPVHIINIDIADNHEDATLGAFLIYELTQIVYFCCSLFFFEFQVRIHFNF